MRQARLILAFFACSTTHAWFCAYDYTARHRLASERIGLKRTRINRHQCTRLDLARRKAEEEEPSKPEDRLGRLKGFFSKKEEAKPAPEPAGIFRGVLKRAKGEEKPKKPSGKDRKKKQKSKSDPGSNPVSGRVQSIFSNDNQDAAEKSKRGDPSSKEKAKNSNRLQSLLISTRSDENSQGTGDEDADRKSILQFFDRKKEPEKDQQPKKKFNPISSIQSFVSTTLAQEEEWVDVFPKTRIMPGESVPVQVGGIDLLVVASVDGRKLYCIANSCPHLGTPLETGVLVRLPVEVKDVQSPPEGSLASLSEEKVSSLLQQDGCEDCIVCPLHKTSFALSSGEVRGEWCPYPPVLGKVVGAVKQPTSAAVFDVRTRGKSVQVRLNSPLKNKE